MAAPFSRSTAPAVGVDVAEVARVSALLLRRPDFADRCFTRREQADCAGHPERWAGRWAVKEAVRKVAGAQGVAPLPAYASIEVIRRPGGAPSVTVAGLDAGLAVSLSHDAGVAVAVVMAGARGPLDGPPALPPPPELVLPERGRTAHKGTFGTVCVVAGAHGFAGAAYLAAMGAARGGAGKVRLAVPEAVHASVAARCIEVMAHPLPDGGLGVLSEAGVEALHGGLLDGVDAHVVGPGLGRAEASARAVAMLLRGLSMPVVVDADGLILAARAEVDWRDVGPGVVITPHPGEMAVLAGTTTAAVASDREELARAFAARTGVTVVLKGAGTVVAAPDGRLAVDAHATPALATGGTGDVLAGLTGALLAAGLEPFRAAEAAVTIHAEAGCAVEAERGRAGALAGDLLDALPAAQERLRRAVERRDGVSPADGSRPGPGA